MIESEIQRAPKVRAIVEQYQKAVNTHIMDATEPVGVDDEPEGSLEVDTPELEPEPEPAGGEGNGSEAPKSKKALKRARQKARAKAEAEAEAEVAPVGSPAPTPAEQAHYTENKRKDP